MDRPRLSAAIIDELTQLFAAALQENAAQLATSDLDGIEQRVQEMARSVFGPVVEEAVRAVAAAYGNERPACLDCHKPMRLVDYARPRHLQGLVGDYQINAEVRPQPDECARRELGLRRARMWVPSPSGRPQVPLRPWPQDRVRPPFGPAAEGP